MGNVRPYDPTPTDPPNDVKISAFGFKLVQVELVDAKKKEFSQKYKITVPAALRARYSDDVVFRGDWASLLNDFDKKFFGFWKLRLSY